jgi:hypothetical protein
MIHRQQAVGSDPITLTPVSFPRFGGGSTQLGEDGFPGYPE